MLIVIYRFEYYVHFATFDGYVMRQFRIRHWHADINFESGHSKYQFNSKYQYKIWHLMSDRNGLG